MVPYVAILFIFYNLTSISWMYPLSCFLAGIASRRDGKCNSYNTRANDEYNFTNGGQEFQSHTYKELGMLGGGLKNLIFAFCFLLVIPLMGNQPL